MYKVRKAETSDFQSIYLLYKKVAAEKGGISRCENEITEDFIETCMKRSVESGIELVVFNSDMPDIIVGEIHCYKPEPKVFSHVLSDTMIVVDPQLQGNGIGKLLFKTLLDEIKNRKDILRLELIVRESNHRAISFYRSIDFRIEGRMERRLNLENGEFEADIPMAWYNSEYRNPKKK